MNNLWPWRNLLASVCIAHTYRLNTRDETQDSDHKTTNRRISEFEIYRVFFLRLPDPNTHSRTR